MQNIIFTMHVWIKDPKKFTCFTLTLLVLPTDCGTELAQHTPTLSASLHDSSTEQAIHREHFGKFSEGLWI